MRIRLRGLLDGAGWALGLAIALFVAALVMLAVVAQSPQALLWAGQHTVGTEQAGLVYFRWHGETYATAVPGNGSAQKVDVYFDPANPANAIADNITDRVITGLLVGGPAAAGVAVLAVGLTRKRRWARRQQRAAGGGQGTDLFTRLLARQRAGQPGGRPR